MLPAGLFRHSRPDGFLQNFRREHLTTVGIHDSKQNQGQS